MILAIIVLALVCVHAPAQVLWKHTISDVWLNPETQEEDSVYCFTALSCFGDNCTAMGRAQRKIGDPISIIVFRSNDGGKSWFEQSSHAQYHWKVLNWGFRKVQQIDSLNVVAMARDGGTIIRTTDGGASWFNIDCPVERELLDIHFSDPMIGVLTCVGGENNVFTTEDGGKTWINRPFTPVYSCHSYGNGKYRFFKYGHGPFYTTDDNFVTIDSTPPLFDSITDPEYQYVFAHIEYGVKDTLYAMANYFSGDSNAWYQNGLIMRSTDDGQSWESPWIFPWMKLKNIRHISSIDRDTIFAAGGDARHYIYSIDRGKTWTLDSILIDIAHETGSCFGMEIASDGHPIAAFGSPGFVHESILTRGEYIPSKVEYTEMIKYYTYFFPNPTNGILNIESRYSLPVTVIDIFGREVVNSSLMKEGKLALDLSHLQPGLYNVIFEYEGEVFIAGKIVLVH